jgi:exosortase family protein XrtF
MIEQFKPALLFLAKFLGIYIIGNMVYGLYINQYYPKADPLTFQVSNQLAKIISAVDQSVAIEMSSKARVTLIDEAAHRSIINVFEGCNGANVAIVFLAFIVAYAGTWNRTLLFGVVGIATIHLFNLGRLWLLFYQAKINSVYFYYFHKYIFTAAIYFVVLLLWFLWVWKINGRLNGKQTNYSS